MKSISTVVYTVNDFEDISFGLYDLKTVSDNSFGEYKDVIRFLDENMVQPKDRVIENLKKYFRNMDKKL